MTAAEAPPTPNIAYTTTMVESELGDREAVSDVDAVNEGVNDGVGDTEGVNDSDGDTVDDLVSDRE
jgi:hypothetical protein